MLGKDIFHFLNFGSAPSACILMYHRVAVLPSDIWNLAVSPERFEQHLFLLKRKAIILPVEELLESLKRGKISKDSIALTFDDGYADNYLTAKPILDNYNLPATFFISSQNIDKEEEFWWDELEYIFMYSKNLPTEFTGYIGGSDITFSLGEETCLSDELQQLQLKWNACEQSPPTLRSALFIKVWQMLKPLPYAEQRLHLQWIRQWAQTVPSVRPEYRSMSFKQLQSLGRSELHSIGGHTVSHSALAFHTKEFQQQEIIGNQTFLESVVNKKITVFAYPYGNYNYETTDILSEEGFQGAFTTTAQKVTKTSNPYQLGRFQVPNSTPQAFEQQLRRWQR